MPGLCGWAPSVPPHTWPLHPPRLCTLSFLCLHSLPWHSLSWHCLRDDANLVLGTGSGPCPLWEASLAPTPGWVRVLLRALTGLSVPVVVLRSALRMFLSLPTRLALRRATLGPRRASARSCPSPWGRETEKEKLRLHGPVGFWGLPIVHSVAALTYSPSPSLASLRDPGLQGHLATHLPPHP